MRLRCTLLSLALGTASSAGPDAGTPTASMELRRAMPFVQVLVNGRGPFIFGIDTGTSSEALIAPDLARTLGLATTGSVQAGDPSGRSPRELPLVRLASLTVAGVEFRGLTAAVYAPSQAEGRCDGILGFALFRDRLLTLDYPGGRLVLGEGTLTPSADGTTLPFRVPDGVPVVDLTVGSEVFPAIVDTRGAGLSLPASRAGQLKLLGEPVVIGRGRTISGEFEIRGAELAEDVQLGAYRLQRPFVALHPSFPVGNVGGIVLRAFVVTFDQRSKLLRLQAPQWTLQLPHPRPRTAPEHVDGGTPPPSR